MSYCYLIAPTSTKLYTLSLHDALPISRGSLPRCSLSRSDLALRGLRPPGARGDGLRNARRRGSRARPRRSEEHTSELQSHSELVCRLLLEKKKYMKQRHDDKHSTQVYQ